MWCLRGIRCVRCRADAEKRLTGHRTTCCRWESHATRSGSSRGRKTEECTSGTRRVWCSACSRDIKTPVRLGPSKSPSYLTCHLAISTSLHPVGNLLATARGPHHRRDLDVLRGRKTDGAREFDSSLERCTLFCNTLSDHSHLLSPLDAATPSNARTHLVSTAYPASEPHRYSFIDRTHPVAMSHAAHTSASVTF